VWGGLSNVWGGFSNMWSGFSNPPFQPNDLQPRILGGGEERLRLALRESDSG